MPCPQRTRIDYVSTRSTLRISAPGRLRSLGSASDHARLVASYCLALARTSAKLEAPHPGFVILDEPLQQNPDEEHREKFLTYLLALENQSDQPFQTLIFTYLLGDEVARLRAAGLKVSTPTNTKFLEVESKEEPLKSSEETKEAADNTLAMSSEPNAVSGER